MVCACQHFISHCHVLWVIQTFHFQDHLVALLKSFTQQLCIRYVQSLRCFDSDTSWTVFYHVNNIDLTAHPNEEGFSLLWDGIRFLSHRHTITVRFPQHLRQSHRNETNPCHLYYQERANKRMQLHQKGGGVLSVSHEVLLQTEPISA